ncbi:MAG: hypothetical protein ACJA0H_000643 [Francisellaceae bacterium]|jgi:hypothetical protein
MKTYFNTPKQILLGEHESTDYLIASIYKHTDLIIKAQDQIRKCQHPLLTFCSVAYFDQYKLILHTKKNIVMSKFKFERDYLLVEIKRIIFFSKITQLEMKLFFDEPESIIKPRIESQFLSSSNTEKLTLLKRDSDNIKLNNALEKLLKKHGR